MKDMEVLISNAYEQFLVRYQHIVGTEVLPLQEALTSRKFFDISYSGSASEFNSLKEGLSSLEERYNLCDEYERALIDANMERALETAIRAWNKNVSCTRKAREEGKQVKSRFIRLECIPDAQWKQLVLFMNRLDELQTLPKKELEIFVFGLYPYGKDRPWTYIDVAVVSEGFDAVPWAKRLQILKECRPHAAKFISPIGITRSELDRNTYPLVISTVRNDIKLIKPKECEL